MPTNESIVAVPITVEQRGQLRQFLVRLVEQLDIVLGYRGNDPYVSLSQLQSVSTLASDDLTRLEQTVLDIITALFTENNDIVTNLLAGIITSTAEAIEALKSTSTITDADDSTQTISSSPTQIEVQNIQDQVTSNAEDFNDLLLALRETGIIAT